MLKTCGKGFSRGPCQKSPGKGVLVICDVGIILQGFLNISQLESCRISGILLGKGFADANNLFLSN